MGIEVALFALAAAGTAYSIDQQRDAKEAQKNAAIEQKKIRNEQRAQNEAQAAQERRKQLREERIRRARIVSSSQAAGTVGSSGEAGALGSLATQLSSNLGANLAAINSAADISLFSQNAANFMSVADQANSNAQMAGQISSLAFQAAPVLSKAGSLFSTPKPTAKPPI